jgi:hypothetical protein
VTAVVLGRLDHAPSKFQSYGLDVCDGEPCFRGIKVGSDWAVTQKLLPDATLEQNRWQINLNTAGSHYIFVDSSMDYKTVRRFGIAGYRQEPLPIYARDLIQQFGAPCQVVIEVSNGGQSDPRNVLLFYPSMLAELDLYFKQNLSRYRLQWDSRVVYLTVVGNTADSKTCDYVEAVNVGPWRGFKSVEDYRHNNLRDLRTVHPAKP